MFTPFINRFIAGPDQALNQTLRTRYGIAAALGGLLANLFLALIKGVIGFLSGSVAITGDAVNNATDSLVNILTLISFRLSGMPADKRHPYGHARLEYIFATLMAAVILFVGGQIFLDSIDKIRHPHIVPWQPALFIVLLISILSKIVLWKYYRELDGRMHSPLLKAAAIDSLNDIRATAAIILSLVISPLIDFDLDGPMGIMVAIIIMKAGWEILTDTIDKLLGEQPDPALLDELRRFIEAYPGIYGIHDLILHDYGPGMRMATLHAEVDAKVSAWESHNLVDRIESDVQESFGIHTTIHMDPLALDDPRTNEKRALILRICAAIDPAIHIHDFRLVDAFYTTNLVFDVSLPSDSHLSPADVEERIQAALAKENPTLLAKINFDELYSQNA